MAASPPLCIEDVVHHAVITVDEHGTEAAAATAVILTDTTSAPIELSPHLLLDRPFLYVVHDVESGVPLFVGRVSDPR